MLSKDFFLDFSRSKLLKNLLSCDISDTPIFLANGSLNSGKWYSIFSSVHPCFSMISDSFRMSPTPRKTQRQMHDGCIPDHGRRAFFAESAQTPLQFPGARTRLPRPIAAERYEFAHLPPIAEYRFRPATNRRRECPQHGHGQLRHRLLESGKALAGAFSLRTARHVERPGSLELLGQAVAAAVGCQQQDVKQRVQVPTRRFPSPRQVSDLLENLRCEKLPDRTDQRLGPPSLAGTLPCASHLPFLHDGAWCCNLPIIAGTAFSCSIKEPPLSQGKVSP